MNQTRKIYYLAFNLIPIICNGQINDSLIIEKNKNKAKLVISLGVNLIKYNSNDDFMNFLYSETDPIGKPPPNYYQYKYDMYAPHDFFYSKLSPSFVKSIGRINIGLELKADKHPQLCHIVTVGYNQIIGEYSNSSSYKENDGPGLHEAYFQNLVQSEYTQKIISFDYKLQYTYKKYFFSIGMISSINLIKISSEKDQQISFWFFNEPSHEWIYMGSSRNLSNSIKNINYTNFTFQAGVGRNIKIKKITFKPAIYIEPYLNKGYNFYTFMIGLLYSKY